LAEKNYNIIMELQPIRRNKHILELSRDHHFTLLFCWKIRQGLKMQIAPERLKNYVNYFWGEHMQPHFREEEEILFKPVNDVKVQKALNDHQQIEDQVVNLLRMTSTDSADFFSKLADSVETHVRYEERQLFPHLEKILTEKHLKFIGAQLKKEEIAKDNYEDEFWIKKKQG